jgi:hypothetical protein
MKIGQLSSILNQELGVHGNNCKTGIDFTLALHRSRTVKITQAEQMKYRRIVFIKTILLHDRN